MKKYALILLLLSGSLARSMDYLKPAVELAKLDWCENQIAYAWCEIKKGTDSRIIKGFFPNAVNSVQVAPNDYTFLLPYFCFYGSGGLCGCLYGSSLFLCPCPTLAASVPAALIARKIYVLEKYGLKQKKQ